MNALRSCAFICCSLLFVLAPRRSPAQRDAWIATWTASPEPADPDPSQPVLNLQDQTVRERVRISVGGSQIRIRLSNEYGSSPLVLGSVTVAVPSDPASVKSGSIQTVTFGGRNSITIPAGAPALSDPVAFPVVFGAEIGVSLYFPKRVTTPTWHLLALKRAVVSPHGDRTHEEKIQGGTEASRLMVLSAVLVPAQPSQRVVVAFGDSIVDGDGSSDEADHNWPSDVIRRLGKAPDSSKWAVVNAGIAGNRLLADGPIASLGVSALTRFDRDALSVPGVTHIVLLEGINDIGFPGAKLGDLSLADPADVRTADDLIGAYRQDALFPGGGSWSKEGSIIFAPQLNGGIYKIPASGGSPTLLLGLDKSKSGGFGRPNFLPDGRHFTYSAYGFEPPLAGTYFASLDGRENKRVAAATGNRAFSSGYLFLFVPPPTGSTADLMAVAFDPVSGNLDGEPKLVARGIDYVSSSNESIFAVSGSTLIYSSSATGVAAGPSLVWLDRSGKRLATVAGSSNASDMKLSPEAQKVAYAKGNPNSDIWVQELKRDVPMRLTFDTSVDKGAPVWSPDGSEILFDIALGGKTPPGIYRKSASGTGREQLLVQPKEPDAVLWPTDWSRHRKFVLCAQGEINARGRGEIWVLPLSDRKPRVFIRAPGAAYDGQFSPDGRWVAYVSRESGREEVYVVPFDGNQVSSTPPFEQVAINNRWQVSPNGGAFPRWRRDGRELFYVARGDQFVAVAVETTGNSFAPGETRPLFREPLSVVAFPYDVSPDGQRFLINRSGDIGTSPFTLVINWKELLENK